MATPRTTAQQCAHRNALKRRAESDAREYDDKQRTDAPTTPRAPLTAEAGLSPSLRLSAEFAALHDTDDLLLWPATGGPGFLVPEATVWFWPVRPSDAAPMPQRSDTSSPASVARISSSTPPPATEAKALKDSARETLDLAADTRRTAPAGLTPAEQSELKFLLAISTMARSGGLRHLRAIEISDGSAPPSARGVRCISSAMKGQMMALGLATVQDGRFVWTSTYEVQFQDRYAELSRRLGKVPESLAPDAAMKAIRAYLDSKTVVRDTAALS